MGALCSTSENYHDHSGNKALSHPTDPPASARQRSTITKMPPAWINEKVTRQKMKKMNGEKEFTSTEDYLQTVNAIIAKENSQAFDGHAVATASALERQAADIVYKIRANDAVTVYQTETDNSGKRRSPGDHFLGNVDIINKTELLRVAKNMPKGAHLHCHFNSCLPPTFLLRQARGMESMYIRATESLDLNDPVKTARVEIQFQVSEPQPDGPDLFSINYERLTLMSYNKFCAEFPGGVEAAEAWLESKLLLNEAEVYGIEQSVEGIWNRFDICTRMLKGLFSYESAFRAYTKACIEDFIDDNIQYAEIRPNFPSNALIKDDASGFIDNTGLLQIIADEVEAQKKSGRYFGGLKVIYCTPRSFKNEMIEAALNECIELKKKFPDLLCGFDLVGSEDRGKPLRAFIPELLEFRRKCNEQGLDLPFLFHAGETLDNGTSTDGNLFDAILLNSKRIGHGFALPRHPLAMQMVKEKGIALEICPISNEILHLTPTMRGHTLPIMLAHDVPCTVNSDNGTFYSSTLSHDFYQVMIGSHTMSLHGWRVLAEWSLKHSCMTPAEREPVYKEWLNRWDAFCQWIVDEYGAQYPDNS